MMNPKGSNPRQEKYFLSNVSKLLRITKGEENKFYH